MTLWPEKNMKKVELDNENKGERTIGWKIDGDRIQITFNQFFFQ